MTGSDGQPTHHHRHAATASAVVEHHDDNDVADDDLEHDDNNNDHDNHHNDDDTTTTTTSPPAPKPEPSLSPNPSPIRPPTGPSGATAMAGPAPEALTDIPPAAREAVSALIAAPTEPVKILVSGGIGTGKSSVLAMVRNALRSADIAVITRAPRAGDDPDAAIVIDDAHLLADEELEQLAERVSDPGSTVVVAAEPLTQRQALRALATALERENPVISLGSLTTPDVTEAAALATGGQPATEIVRALMVSTAGLPFLLRPAIAAAVSPNGEPAVNAIVEAAKVRVDRAAAPSR